MASAEGLINFNIEQGKRKRAAQMLNYEVIKSGCWIWQGSVFTDGYGKCPRHGKTRRAHRVFYTEHVGAIPEGLQVLHKCDTPLCVNPDHLLLGTHKDNMADRAAKGRNPPNPAIVYPERLKRGDDNHMKREEYRALRRNTPPGNRKLSPNAVVQIAESAEKSSILAKQYGVSASHITLIRRGYRHVCKG